VSTASVSGLYIDGTLVAEDTVASLLSAEERVEVFAWHFNTASCTPPSDTIRVVADYRDLIDESYEDNNEGSITWACAEFRPPDLHIRRVWTEPISTSEHRIGYEVENIGTGPAPTSRTGLYVDDVLVAEDAVVALAPLERREKVFSYTYNLTSCSGDSDTIRVVVDFALAVSETNEGNNEESLVWECPEGAKPDLVIHTVWWEHEPNSLQNITLNYSIENRSIAPAGPSVTRLWINDVQVATSNVPALDGGEVLAMVTFPERWTPQLNNNHVLIRADIYDNVDESYAGERNNLLEADWTFQLCCCNRLQDRDETGIDCGGRHCPPCNRCDLTTLPSRFDWRDYFTLPPIRDQADCGSCWAHAAVGAIEGTYAINTGIIINLSEQYVICEVTGNCDGGCPHDVYRHARSTGIIEELCQPYLARNSPCSKCSDWRYKLWRIANYGRVSSSIEAIKRALICYGPLSVGSENWEHAIVIVGYDDSKSSWIIRNSWGTGWGEDLNGDGFPDDPGYGSVPYTGHSHSDIRDYVHYVIGVLAP
jgi:C1A family cysteine protease